jgi:hypothetical protein
VSTFGAALIGMVLHASLPERHLDGDSRDVVKLVMGLIATMAALVLGLLIASAQSAYNAQNSALQTIAANIIALDHSLAFYGQETTQVRSLLRQAVATTHDQIWSAQGVQSENLDPRKMQGRAYTFYMALQGLTPGTGAQRFAQSRALQLAGVVEETRLLMFEQSGGALAWPFLAVLVFWVSVLFLGFGLFVRFQATVTVALFSAALFLILELNSRIVALFGCPTRRSAARSSRSGRHRNE